MRPGIIRIKGREASPDQNRAATAPEFVSQPIHPRSLRNLASDGDEIHLDVEVRRCDGFVDDANVPVRRHQCG